MKIDPKLFYFEETLYNKKVISKEDYESVYNLVHLRDKFDAFCPFCQRESIFIADNKPVKVAGTIMQEYFWSFSEYTAVSSNHFYNFVDRDFKVLLKCTRDETLHRIFFYVRVERDAIYKIGQNPSFAELSEAFQNKKYRALIPSTGFAEFNKAIGLHSHNVGIGSFVYLRRIFENLITEAGNIAKSEVPGWSEDIFLSKKMDGKIELLKNYLPEFLVKNRSLYGILSKGIHELTEEACLEIFPIVRNGIELILDEKLRKIETEKKIKETTERIAAVKGKV